MKRFDYLGDPNIQEGFVLGRHIVKEIDTKVCLIELRIQIHLFILAGFIRLIEILWSQT